MNPDNFSSSSSEITVDSNSFDAEQNTSHKLCSVLLNKYNYLPWSRAITIALGGRSKLGFINGKEAVPELLFFFSRIMGSCSRNEGKSFVSILGKLKNLWNELEVYRPHTTDPVILKKRVEEDRVFQLLASLDSDYEEFRSHILMTTELPSLKNVCAAIQREEVHRKIMPKSDVLNTSNPHAYLTLNGEKKPYKGKRPDLKCDHCRGIGYTIDRCWILHPELKNKSSKDKKGSDQKHSFNSKAHVASHSAESFTSNTITLLNEFANFLHNKQSTGTSS
ncbi:hypothetical protein ZIOFF_033861 [Zingiber officinale]|uniref:Retrotransposon Copia-like N-terminal domain-containing protein n=1 Tax=Zingiber officinale TaxID=94328 RepID=A0A8J5GNH2_ZINOF|nr:hypothetical protein ZIOFF_033861 [Zingiber officinale]